MSVWRSLSFRVGAAALASALGGAVLVGGVTLMMVGRQMIHWQVERFAPIDAAALDACAAAPDTWRDERPGEVLVWAVDGASFTSRDPTAPAVHPMVRAQAQLGAEAPFRPVQGPHGPSITGLWATGRPEPCAWVGLRWPLPPADGPRPMLLWLGLSLAMAVVSVMGANLVAVRPVARRIDLLLSAARRVGRPDYAPQRSHAMAIDGLGALAGVLDDAHGRVRAELDEALAREQALEGHLAEVAHDLRTPLASAQLSLEAARDGATDPAQQARTGDALEELVYLAQLVENLRVGTWLDEADRAGGAMADWKPADLAGIVDRIGRRFARLGALRDIAVHTAVDDGLTACCHPVLVEQAISNLVHNAVRHNRDGGRVAIVLERTGAGFRLEVVDDGPGGHPAVFAGALSRPAGALRGRGLSICQRVCALHAWSLVLEHPAEGGLLARIASG